MPAAIPVTPYSLAARFLGVKEAPGHVHNPLIVAMMDLTDRSVRDDETPWCSGFVNYVAWLLGVARSKSLRARSWLTIGMPVRVEDARPGFDVVILSRGPNAPPASVLSAPGHVGFFAGFNAADGTVEVLGGNQADSVSLTKFPIGRVLGIRRIA